VREKQTKKRRSKLRNYPPEIDKIKFEVNHAFIHHYHGHHQSLVMSQRRRNSTIALSQQTAATGAGPTLHDDDDNDEYMDSTDSNTRPMTRSLAKLQNSISPSLKSLESQLQDALRAVSSKFPNPPPPQTYQKVFLVDEKPANLINILENSMLSGRRPNSIAEFPDSTLQLITQRLHTHDYPLLVKRLEQLSVTLNFRNNSREFHELMKLLGVIEPLLGGVKLNRSILFSLMWFCIEGAREPPGALRGRSVAVQR
jgi:hypothetical protein